MDLDERLVREPLDADDRATLRAWVATFGDAASAEGVRARVKLLLTLRDAHPARPTLDALLDDPRARAVLGASLEGRGWAMRRYVRWCERKRARGRPFPPDDEM